MDDHRLLATKLYIPRPRPDLVPRPRLVERLNEGLYRKLTLVSAPAGFGKTTLISDWLCRIELPATWLSLDEADNDPIRFFTYLIAVIQQIDPGPGQLVQAMLDGGQPQPPEVLMTTLINEIVEAAVELVLVLEDYHLIQTESIHEALTFLLDHLPPQLHLVIIGRTAPPLPLTRLRVRDELTELHDTDLRFTPTEATAFLNRTMGLDLSPEDVTALEARTEGWVAGLQLAALSMQGRSDPRRFVRAFTGSHRYVIDYLADEVLSRQPASIRQFLLRTSILDRFCGPLGDALLELDTPEAETDEPHPPPPFPDLPRPGAASQQILEALEAANLFIVPLDDERRWYRYHHLFGDFLRERLAKTLDRSEILALHRRASSWYAWNDLITPAINHALAAGDIDQATGWIEEQALTMLIQGQVVSLIRWLEMLPEERIRARPRLSLAWAWARIIINEWDDVEPLLEAAEAALPDRERVLSQAAVDEADPQLLGMWGEVAAMRAMKLGTQGDFERSTTLAYQALEWLPESNLLVRSVLNMHLGAAYEIGGDLAKARQALTEAIAIAQASGNLIIVLTAGTNQARLEEEQGRLHRAAEYYRQTLTHIQDQAQKRGLAGERLPMVGWPHLGLAEVLREQNQLAAARRHLATGLELADLGHMRGIKQVGHIILARILQAEGDEAGALEAIRAADSIVHQSSPVLKWIAAVQARLWLAQGYLAAAVHWADHCNLPLDEPLAYAHYPGEYSTLVRVRLAQQDYEEALDLLQRLRPIAEASQRTGRLLELLMLEALAWSGQGDVAEALSLLAQALAMAEPGGYVRLFVDEGPPLAALLRHMTARGEASTYIRHLLAAFGDPLDLPDPAPASTALPAQPQPLLDPLSERELEVLQLVADGLSNQEIADRLVIAVSTVKSHTNKIFSKLDAQNRTQAVAKARELKLL